MSADDVSYIPAGIDAERFSPNPNFERGTSNEAVVIYYGHLTKSKGVENLIKAMPLVIGEYPRAKLKIMWTGHGRSYKKVMTLVRKLKLSKHIVVKNTICKDIPSFLKHADIGVLPLLSSNATANPPRTLLEMMSAGLPTVATNIGGVSEIIKHRETGILVDSSPESIANGILSLLFNRSLADKISRAAQDYVKANHDWSQVGPIYTKFYEELI
jgi:glycosyltransferase involved in cell wall biosynthesis